MPSFFTITAVFTSLLLLSACSSTPATSASQATLPDWYLKTQVGSTNTSPSPTSSPITPSASAKSTTTAAASSTTVAPDKTTTAQPKSAGNQSEASANANSGDKTTAKPSAQDETSTAKSTTSNTAPLAIDNTKIEQQATSATTTAADNNNDAAKANGKTNHLTQNHQLEPFKASFRIYVSKIPMPITAELELKPQAQADTWKMRFEVDSFLMHNLEESTFTWNNCHPKSIHYHHDFKGFGKHQFHDTSFFWKPPHVENHSDEDSQSFTIPANSVDDLTVLLQAACVLSEGADDYYATSVYGDQIRDNHFKLIRRETIDTPLGKLDTLVVEKVREHDNGRHTLFWISPKLNFMLVKAKHIENPVLFGEVIMKSYEGPHLPESK